MDDCSIILIKQWKENINVEILMYIQTNFAFEREFFVPRLKSDDS